MASDFIKKNNKNNVVSSSSSQQISLKNYFFNNDNNNNNNIISDKIIRNNEFSLSNKVNYKFNNNVYDELNKCYVKPEMLNIGLVDDENNDINTNLSLNKLSNIYTLKNSLFSNQCNLDSCNYNYNNNNNSSNQKNKTNKISNYFTYKNNKNNYSTFIIDIKKESSLMSNKHKLINNKSNKNITINSYFKSNNQSNLNNNKSENNNNLNSNNNYESFNNYLKYRNDKNNNFDCNLLHNKEKNDIVNLLNKIDSNIDSTNINKNYNDINLNNINNNIMTTLKSSESVVKENNNNNNNNNKINYQLFAFDDVYEQKFNTFVDSCKLNSISKFKSKQSQITNFYNSNNINNINKLNNNYNKWCNLPLHIYSLIYNNLSLKEVFVLQYVSKSFNNTTKNICSIHSSFPLIQSKMFNYKQLKYLLNKANKLIHIKLLSMIIKNDFSDSCKSFLNRCNFIIILSVLDDNQHYNDYNGFLLSTIKIKPSLNQNLISNNSVNILLDSSRNSIKELTLKSCVKINNNISKSIINCIYLKKIDLSNNE